MKPTPSPTTKTRRVVTPSKGGRTAWISGCRATPATKARLAAILSRDKLSLGDLIEQVAKERE